MPSEMDRETNMRMSEGCDELSGKIVKLAKSLSGLNQGPRFFRQLLMSKFFLLSLER